MNNYEGCENMKQIKHFTAVILLVSMILTMFTPLQAYGENVEPLQFDGTQSSWAEPEIKEAYDMSLTYPVVTNNFNRYITREEFCTLVIRLYVKLTGQTPTYGENPFKDTTNTEILKAFSLGIVKGTSADTFAPLNNISRQEMCVMILRALNASVQGLDASAGEFPFKDANKIAPWAIDAMKFAYKNGIMKGLSAETIDPLSNTPREQAIILLLRTYKKFSVTSAQAIEEAGTVRLVKPPMISKNNREKFEFTMIENNIFFPKYEKKLDLYVSNKAGRPSAPPKFSSVNEGNEMMYAASGNNLIVPTLPDPILPTPITPTPTIPIPKIDPNIIVKPDLRVPIIHPPFKERTTAPMYVNSDFGAFIDKNSDSVRWFSYKINNVRGYNAVSKIVWQVSETQFSGTKESFKTEQNMVLSGEVLYVAKEFSPSREFSIDFSKIKASTPTKRPIPQEQKTYYVRAVPVDALGNPIGDPGKGIAVLYGLPVLSDVQYTEPAFEIWTTKSHLGYESKEFNDVPTHDPWDNGNWVSYDPTLDSPRFFHFHGLDENATKIYVQVYDEDFDKNQDYIKKDNLVYESEYNLKSMLPVKSHEDLNPSVTIDFKEFGKKDMKAEEYIEYFVRAAAITEDIEPGKLKAVYSDIVTVKYGFGKPVTIIAQPVPPSPYDKVQTINYTVPNVKIVGYTAIDWADPDYMSRYYVFKEPGPNEIKCSWQSNNGKILRPYKYYLITGEFGASMAPTIPYDMLPKEFKSSYEQLIKEVLPVGAEIYIAKPEPKDEPWYQELYNGVVDFFKDVVSIIAKIYKQLNATYENIKTKLIAAVANLCPIESLRNEFKAALTALVDYGLASVGIPPKFPNFEQMVEGNIGYLAQVALTEAGVPANQITDAMTKKAAEGIVGHFKEADKATHHENPVNASFLKLDPKALYQPACLEVKLENFTDYPTAPGTLDLNVQFKLKEQGFYATSYDPVGLNLTADTYEYSYNPYSAAYTSSEYWNHFVYGLNGYTVDYKDSWNGTAVYEIFNPVVDLKLPVVPPNSSVNIKIYLEPGGFASTSRYPDAEPSRYEDFYNMYQNNGGADYTWFELTTSFPEARDHYYKEGTQNGNIMVLDPKTDYRYYVDNSKLPTLGRSIQLPVNTDW